MPNLGGTSISLADGWTGHWDTKTADRFNYETQMREERPLTQDELRGLGNYFQSDEYIGGRTTALAQAAADTDYDFGNLIVPAIMALTGAGFMGVLPGMAGASTGATAASIGAGDTALWGAGGAAETMMGGTAAATAGTSGASGIIEGLLNVPGTNQAILPPLVEGGAELYPGMPGYAERAVELGLPASGVIPGMAPPTTTTTTTTPTTPSTDSTDPYASPPTAPPSTTTPTVPVPGQSVWDRFLADPSAANLTALLGAAGPGLLSEYFANQRSDNLSTSLSNIANQARTDRQPFLDYATNTLRGGPDAWASNQGAGALQGVLARLSARGGNPYGDPGALMRGAGEIGDLWGNDWRQAANIGLGGNYSQLATNAATAGVPTSGAGYGQAIGEVFTPRRSNADMWESLGFPGLT